MYAEKHRHAEELYIRRTAAQRGAPTLRRALLCVDDNATTNYFGCTDSIRMSSTLTRGRTQVTPYGHHPDETTNGCAIAALFAALAVFVPAAIVLAWIAIRETARRPHEQGFGLAVAAIVIAVVEIAVVVVLLFSVGLPFGDWTAQ